MADLDARLQLEAEKFRQAGKDPGSSFRGLYIDEAEARQLFAGLAQPQPALIGVQGTVEKRLRRLQQLFGCSDKEAWILLAIVAADFDLRYERIFAYLQDDVTRKRPNVDLMLRLTSSSHDDPFTARRLFSPSGTLVRRALVSIRDDTPDASAPLLASALQADERVVSYLLGSDEIDARLRPFARMLPGERHDPGESDSMLAQLDAISGSWLATGTGRLVALDGPQGVGKRRFGQRLAGQLEGGLLCVDSAALLRTELAPISALRLLFREATLQESPMYWSNVDAIWDVGERQATFLAALVDELAGWRGVVVFSGPLGWPAPPAIGDVAVARITFSMPSAHERLALWQAELAHLPDLDASMGDSLRQLAGGLRLTRGQIHEAVTIATGECVVQGRPTPVEADLLAASRAVSGRALRAVGDEIVQLANWDDIVLPQDSMDQLAELCACVRCRGIVLDDWGFAASLGSGTGTTALFAGPSGTGKTMAAGIIAKELGLPIYRIDLARLFSKWIGETEKNLDRVFRAAEDSNAVLFLDEADALLGKRSEVKDSHDRYANLEISYLLQKMELYDGVAVLATNMPQQLDQAFLRRLTFTVFFPLPDEAQRLAIWQTLWPKGLPRAGDVDLGQLAQFNLAGGHIRNILLAAAYLAASNGGAVAMSHLRHALRREYQKLGKDISEAAPET
jgi:AAA+ superfamily predicted ATPase